jgi:prepilin-type N-terminal cleavage/methylation domain-containing protein
MAGNPRNSAIVASGFTLIELLVVMVILGICAGVAIPYLAGTADMQASSGARLIASDLEYAKNMAITHQDPVTVRFRPVSENYSLSNQSGPLIHPMTKNDYTVTFDADNGYSKLDLVSASFAGQETVVFDELGAPDDPGSVTIQAGTHRYRIDVAAATGKVTVTMVGS